MRSFTRERRYDAAPAAVLALWRDQEFLDAVGRRFGGTGSARIESAGDRVRVHTQREIPLDKVPSFTRRFIGSPTLDQVDDWPRELPGAEAPATGTWEVRGSMPATMSGTQEIRPDGAGAVVVVEGSVAVSAPLIAGKVEELVTREITKLIGLQQDFAAEWLAGRRPGAPSSG